MPKQTRIPEGYALAQLHDGQWYPLEAERIWYGPEYPDGILRLLPFNRQFQLGEEISFASRREALRHCEAEAKAREDAQRFDWQRLMVQSEVYPERCAWYRQMIEDVTGYAPAVRHWFTEITVFVPAYTCCHGCSYGPVGGWGAWTIEEALADVAEQVYARMQTCARCMQQQEAETDHRMALAGAE